MLRHSFRLYSGIAAATSMAATDASAHASGSSSAVSSLATVIGDNTLPSLNSTSLIPSNIQDLTVRLYFEHPVVNLGVQHFAEGKLVERISDEEGVVEVRDVHLSPLVEVSSRVHVSIGQGGTSPSRITSGIVGKINSDGTFGILLMNNTFLPDVPPRDVYLVEGRSRIALEKDYADMLEWVRDAGVRRHADRERICAMLAQRGWQEANLYLLEGPDIHCMSYINKSVRCAVLEKAEFQRMHHNEMRTLLRERVKERDWRYFVQKFSGFVSANWAGLGVLSVFLWNFKNYRCSQRSFQQKHAVSTLTHSGSHLRDERGQFVGRLTEENWARQILRQLVIARPRMAVLTGYSGCGKSTLFRSSVRKENKPALFVEVRDHEDTLACIIKSMRVPNPECCGDYLDFITDAFKKATKIIGEPPIVVIALREGSQLMQVYNETVVLACDRMLCHLVIEVPLESVTPANVALPRVDFYFVPNFTPRQAFEYTQHSLDPVSLQHFVEVVGTNTYDIDELLAAINHRQVSCVEYTNKKLCKAMRQVSAAWNHKPGLRDTLRRLAEPEFNLGLHMTSEPGHLSDALLKDIVLYDAVQDRWVFKHKALHTATRCCA